MKNRFTQTAEKVGSSELHSIISPLCEVRPIFLTLLLWSIYVCRPGVLFNPLLPQALISFLVLQSDTSGQENFPQQLLNSHYSEKKSLILSIFTPKTLLTGSENLHDGTRAACLNLQESHEHLCHRHIH